MTTKEKILKRLKKGHWSFDLDQKHQRLLNEVEVARWFENPVCLKTDCLSEDIRHVGENESESLEVYKCGSCEAVTLINYEIKHNFGCVGCKEDIEALDY